MKRNEFIKKYNKATPMSKKEELSITKSAVDTAVCKDFRGDRNLLIATEELAELQQCLIKYLRGKGDRINTLEEVADVYLALDFVQEVIGFTDEEIEKAKAVKLNRLKETIYKKGTFK